VKGSTGRTRSYPRGGIATQRKYLAPPRNAPHPSARVYLRQNVLRGTAYPPSALFHSPPQGRKRTGSKSKEITWHNSRRESGFLASAIALVKFLFGSQLSPSAKFRAGREKREGNVEPGRRRATRRERAANNVRGERGTNFFSGAPERRFPEEERGIQGTVPGRSTKGEGCRPDGMEKSVSPPCLVL